MPCGGGYAGVTIFLLILIYHESGNWDALMPRGHFLLSSHKRKQKEPREHISRDPLALRHCGSGKQKPRSNPFGETPENSLQAQTLRASRF